MRYLDSLRGWAILAVLAVHAGTYLTWSPVWSEVAFTGQRGVQLFFIVSAFTLCLSHSNRSRQEASPTRNFFLRRFFRLAPMYYLAILLAVLGGQAGKLWEVVLGVFFLQGVTFPSIVHVASGTWSLADEAFFYACLPLLLRRIRSFRSAVIAFVVLTVPLNLLSRFLLHRFPDWNPFFAFFWFPIELPVFLLGIVGYYAWKDKLSPRFPQSSPKAKQLSLLLLAGAAFTYYLNLPSTERKLLVSSFGCMLLVLALALHPWRPLVNRGTVFLGRISFSLYLLHPWLLDWLRPHVLGWLHHRHPFVAFAVLLSSTLLIVGAASTLTWRYIEEFGIQLGRKIIARLEHRDTTRAVAGAGVSLNPLHPSRPDEQL